MDLFDIYVLHEDGHPYSYGSAGLHFGPHHTEAERGTVLSEVKWLQLYEDEPGVVLNVRKVTR